MMTSYPTYDALVHYFTVVLHQFEHRRIKSVHFEGGYVQVETYVPPNETPTTVCDGEFRKFVLDCKDVEWHWQNLKVKDAA